MAVILILRVVLIALSLLGVLAITSIMVVTVVLRVVLIALPLLGVVMVGFVVASVLIVGIGRATLLGMVVAVLARIW